MADLWLPGFERVWNARNHGGTIRRPDAPARGVLHSTEVPAADLRRLAGVHEWPPHIWADPLRRYKAMTVPLNRSAYALRATPLCETNHMGVCIQIEIHIRAADAPHLPDWQLDWLATEVLAPVAYVCGIPEHAWLPTLGNEAYGTNGPARMSVTQWERFSGWTTHQAVPGNSHWDAGRIDLARLVARAYQPVSPPLEEDFMAALTDDQQRDLYERVLDMNHEIVGPPSSGRLRSWIAKQLGTVRGDIAQLPRSLTAAEAVAIAEDAVDEIIARFDGVTVDGRAATGDDARRLLAELIGATIP